MNAALSLSAVFVGSLGFVLLFNVRGRNVLPAALGGLMAHAILLATLAAGLGEAASTALAAFASALYAQGMARLRRSPATQFLVPALIPLLPGGLLYYTMLSAVSSDWLAFGEGGARTLTLAGAIAAGLAVGAAFGGMLRMRGKGGGK